MPSKNKKYISLKSVCDGLNANELAMIAIIHQKPDPIADLNSLVVRVDLSTDKPKIHPVLIGNDVIKSYYSWFKCIVNDGRRIYIGEDDGYIVLDHSGYQVIDISKIPSTLKMKGSLECAYVHGEKNIIFGTYHGQIIHVNDGKYEVHQIIPRDANDNVIERIDGLDDFMVAVERDGVVAKYENGKWQRFTAPANTLFEAICCVSKTEIYVGGWRGRLWRWDGDGRWKKLKISFDGDMTNFYICDIAHFEGSIYAACSRNGIYKLEGDTLVPVPKIKSEVVVKLFVTHAGLIGLGVNWGESGSWFTRFHEGRWTAEQINIKL